MPLFRERPVRSLMIVVLAMAGGYFVTNLMSSIHTLHLTQTSIAIAAIALLMYLVTMHHRQEGQFLTQSQEEYALIGGFGLFWIVALLAWRAISQRDTGRGGGGLVGAGSKGSQWPCGENDRYCIIEEWSYY